MKTLFRLLSVFPLLLLHMLGGVLGWIVFLASAVYRQRFLDNARQAGYGFAQVRTAIAESGKLLLETPRIWFGPMPPVYWEQADLVRAIRAEGRGIVFLTPHLGCFEVTASSYASQFGPVTVLYRPARKEWLRELVATSRSREHMTAVPTTLAGVRQMLRTLRSGGAVGLLPDQVPPSGLGVWAPFFGRAAYTMTLPARLVQQTGAALLLVWGERLRGGRGYQVHVHRFEGELASDPAVAAAQINAEMERMVRAGPAQYLWGYARYKQPAAERVR